MASSSKLSHAASVSNTGVPAALPEDALFEVLLRLPAKDLCRLRAVCRSWRALTSHPHFAAEHKSRHAEPLFALTFRDGDVRGVAIASLSGQILRRIRFASDRIEFFAILAFVAHDGQQIRHKLPTLLRAFVAHDGQQIRHELPALLRVAHAGVHTYLWVSVCYSSMPFHGEECI